MGNGVLAPSHGIFHANNIQCLLLTKCNIYYLKSFYWQGGVWKSIPQHSNYCLDDTYEIPQKFCIKPEKKFAFISTEFECFNCHTIVVKFCVTLLVTRNDCQSRCEILCVMWNSSEITWETNKSPNLSIHIRIKEDASSISPSSESVSREVFF